METRKRYRGTRAATVFVAAALAAALALGACGGSSKKSSSATTTATAPATTAPAAPATTAAAGPTTTGSGGAASLSKIEAAAEAGSKATFKLTYSSTSNGTTSTITLEQDPPNQVFKSGSGELLVTGGKTYFCGTSTSSPTCTVYSSSGATPLSSIMDIYDGSTYVSYMKSWQSLISTGITGYHISFTSTTYAGQPSQCAKWDYQGNSAQYCFTDSGMLAYVGTTGSNIELTGYSATVPASDFALPSGATVITLP